tara:strand:- start:475 stop:714 length:240 start_codon:yes stop_codon:yes gene_type:complete
MNKKEILKELNNIFIDVLENDEILISETTTSDDLDDWDSLNHIHLVVAIEKFFKIRFTSLEITTWKNIGDLIHSIEIKQ